MFNSLKIAFSMYSKIPMPHTDWNEKNMRYAMCFFPLVGSVIGFLYYLWFNISLALNINDILRSAIYVVIPILVTGGIHVDGFVDTMDAYNSYQSIERKLEILKDSHIGAFALISFITYFIINFGAVSEISSLNSIMIIALGFMLSRAFSALAVVKFKSAKNNGLARTFKDSSQKKTVMITMICYITLISLAMICIDLYQGIGAVVAAVLTFIYYKNMSYKKFGGITGDLAGFFLQVCELFIILAVVFINILVRGM